MKRFLVMVHDAIRTEGSMIEFITVEYTGIEWNKKTDAEHEAGLARSVGHDAYIKEIKR